MYSNLNNLGNANITSFDLENLFAHGLLIHNWFESYEFTFDSPMWSIALEWQLYFVFTFILLVLWRRFGILATLMIALIVGIAPHFMFNQAFDFVWPWFLGLFALGMFGQKFVFPKVLPTAFGSRLPLIKYH